MVQALKAAFMRRSRITAKIIRLAEDWWCCYSIKISSGLRLISWSRPCIMRAPCSKGQPTSRQQQKQNRGFTCVCDASRPSTSWHLTPSQLTTTNWVGQADKRKKMARTLKITRRCFLMWSTAESLGGASACMPAPLWTLQCKLHNTFTYQKTNNAVTRY